MKIPVWVCLMGLQGLALAGMAVMSLIPLHEAYLNGRFDLAYVSVGSEERDGQTCTGIVIYKGEELAGEKVICGPLIQRYQAGEMLKVLWIADQPDTAKIYSFGHYWAGDLSLLAMGLNLLVIAALGWQSSRTNRVPEELMGPKASTVNLKVFGVQENQGLFKGIFPGSGGGKAIYASYDPMDDAFSLFPQTSKGVQPRDQLRIFKFVVPGKSKDGISRPIPNKGSIIRAKLDLSDSHGRAYWPDHESVSSNNI